MTSKRPTTLRRPGKLLRRAFALLLLPGVLLFWSGQGSPALRASSHQIEAQAQPVETKLLATNSLQKGAVYQDPDETAGLEQTRGRTSRLIEGAIVDGSQQGCYPAVGSELEVAAANIARYGQGKGRTVRCVYRLSFDGPIGAMTLSLDRLKLLDTYRNPYFSPYSGDTSPFIHHRIQIYATTNSGVFRDPNAAWSAGDLAGSFETSAINQTGRTSVQLDGAALARITSGVSGGGTLYLVFRGFEELSRLTGRGIYPNHPTQVISDDAVQVDFSQGNHLASIQYGESSQCQVLAFEGGFQPTQGVFQDDPTFADKPGKRLVKVDGKTYRAELPMVKGRLTLLVGNRDSRTKISLRAVTNCTQKVPAGWKFSLIQGGNTVLFEGEKHFSLPLDGPPGPEQAFEVSIDASAGLPAPPLKPFKFSSAGAYELRQEIARADGKSSNIAVKVTGEVVETKPPAIHLQPITIQSPENAVSLETYRDALAKDAQSDIPDYFPVESRQLLVARWPNTHLDRLLGEANGWANWRIAKLGTGGKSPAALRRAAIGAVLDRYFDTSSKLGDGGRWVLLMTGQDFGLLGEVEATRAGTFGNKIIAVDTTALGLPPAVDSAVAHEVAHTLPALWGDAQMLAECGRNYHNQTDNVANGFQITAALKESRRSIEKARSVMEAFSADPRWIDQCTYWHLLNELRNPRDPAVILVSGRIARDGQRVAGEILGMYQTTGVVDLNPGAGGDWAVVLRDAAGAQLGRYPFTPQWQLPTHPPVERDLMAISYRVPAVAGVKRIELVGPGGILDAKSHSANAPAVTVTAPVEGSRLDPAADGRVPVAWKGADADGDRLRYTVLYSPDGGSTWSVRAFEQEITELNVAIDRTAWQHQVKLIVTDGGGSSETLLTFRTGEQPGTGSAPLDPSPQGLSLFFSVNETKEIWVPYFSGVPEGQATKVSGLPATTQYLVWAPGGTRVLHVLAGPGLRIQDLRAATMRDLVPPDVYAWGPAWSPDGKRVVLNAISPSKAVALYSVMADGAGFAPLAPTLAESWSATFSPDGKMVAFIGRERLGGEVSSFVLDLAGGAPRRLPLGKCLPSDPNWSPDGTALVFVCATGDVVDIRSYSFQTGAVTPLIETKVGVRALQPTTSPDGKYVAYLIREKGVLQVWIYDVQARRSIQLTTGASGVAWEPLSWRAS